MGSPYPDSTSLLRNLEVGSLLVLFWTIWSGLLLFRIRESSAIGIILTISIVCANGFFTALMIHLILRQILRERAKKKETKKQLKTASEKERLNLCEAVKAKQNAILNDPLDKLKVSTNTRRPSNVVQMDNPLYDDEKGHHGVDIHAYLRNDETDAETDADYTQSTNNTEDLEEQVTEDGEDPSAVQVCYHEESDRWYYYDPTTGISTWAEE